MYAERLSVTLTTDGAQAATGYISVEYGRLMSIHYVKDDFTNGVDFTITVDSTGEGLWTESNVDASTFRYPRAAVQDIVGVAAKFAAAGTNIVEPVFIARDRIKIVIASGGATKSGTFTAVIG